MRACLRLHPTVDKRSRRRAAKAGHPVTFRVTWEQLQALRALAEQRGEYAATTSAHLTVRALRAEGVLRPAEPTPDALAGWLP